MRWYVLGSLRVERADGDGAGPVDVGARKSRAVVAALALTPGRPVSADLLADLVWAGEPPKAAHGTLHSYISGLRRALEPDRAARSAAAVLGTTDHGYVLHAERGAVDAHRFADAVRSAERALAPLATQLATGRSPAWPSRAEVTAAVDVLDEALGLWAGEPYADLPDHPDVAAERARLHQLRASAEELRLLGLLALGEHASVLSATEAATALQPLRERLWALHALALTRAGRQADALASLRRIRELLADELGLDPGAELRDLERAILRQEPALLDVLPADPAAPAPAPAAPVLPPTERAEVPATRVADRAVLHGLLDRAGGGSTAAGLLVGEPGIGKSWLLADLAREAEARGVSVAVGQCSQDDGAPPLWPWLSVLRALDVPGAHELTDLPASSSGGESPAAVAFQTWDRVATAVLDAAATRPLLVVLDDLHWADDATLRTLRHLLSVAPEHSRLALVASRRAHPEPTGALAEVSETFARRHATRLDLAGLDVAEAGRLVRDVAGDAVPERDVAALHARAEGNPFFLVELARLGGDSAAVPATVRDVLARRLDQLPAGALDTLRTAAVVGRRFRLETVASAAGTDEEAVADDLETARLAGLVVDVDAGLYRFAHALTHEAVLLTLPPTRRARAHAVVAHALESDATVRALYAPDELTAELARHWLAAGPTHATRAWAAADAAATQARRLSAYGEAARLREAAVDAHRRTPGAEPADRYGMLLDLARDAAYAANWFLVVDSAFEAMALGRGLGSPEKVARAAESLTYYCVWTPHEWEEVFEDAIDDLRWALAALPEEDSEARCVALVALAAELYYDHEASAERAALVDAGLAVARRLGDPRVLWWATRAGWIASWRPERTHDRIAWSEEGLAAARALGDPAAEAVSLLALATDHLEMGNPEGWDRYAREAERIGERERLPYVLFTVSFVELNLTMLRGDAAGVATRLALISEVAPQVALPARDIVPAVYGIIASLWSEDVGQFVPMVPLLTHQTMSYPTAHVVLARGGAVDELREGLVRWQYHEADQTWQTLLSYAFEAEAAAAAQDAGLARRALDRLTPYLGRMAVGGVAMAVGPVDGYAALAAATCGDRAAATAWADRAAELAEAWRLPVYATWLSRHRERLGI
ncbi:BTAD domain-containing putative transcriptional regulator [Nocardioides iriomotensis]|uniref:BTAD domain-containing putative transcriptional regulator n=1 Tax=Nocardioides iriomotensis TaxID=715784 RepID=UPI0013EB4F68|nr:BTAD domain-containing putative transcriptional regulator [Nocardioides iriomotensis]